MALRRAVLLVLVGGCGGAIHDVPLGQMDMADAGVDGDLASVSDLLDPTAWSGGMVALAPRAVNGSLYGMRLQGSIGTLDVVSIAEADGAVTSLAMDPGTLARDVAVDDAHVYWTELGFVGNDPTLHRANLDGSGAKLFFDPMKDTGVPSGAQLATWYVSEADDRIYVVLTQAATAYFGWLPRAGGSYSGLAMFSGTGTLSFSTPAIAIFQSRAYVAARDGQSSFVESLPSSLAGMAPAKVSSTYNGKILAITSTSDHVYWTGDGGALFAFTPGGGEALPVTIPTSANWLLANGAVLVGTATVGSMATLFRFDPSKNAPEMLAEHAPCATGMTSCITLPPSVAIDGTTAYFSSGMALYKIALQ